MTRNKTPHISISDRDGLPYSKGLMASQVMVTGLSVYRSYEVAETIELRLLDAGRSSVASSELSDLALMVIQELAGDRYATNFGRWQDVERLDVPLVILIGGATGVGKSTIATHLAHRLGIVRVVATDGSIREVMRSMLSAELMPTLHVSSFQTDTVVREPTRRSDALVAGFREQTAAVSVGIDALIKRAAADGTSIVIEGVHVVPGFFDLAAHEARIVPVPLVFEVEEESRHLHHFAARETGVRPAARYANNFGNIRKLQRYIKSQALSHGVPIIPNHSFDQAISAVLDLVMDRATARVAQEAEQAHQQQAEEQQAEEQQAEEQQVGPQLVEHEQAEGQQIEEQQTRQQQVGQQGRTA